MAAAWQVWEHVGQFMKDNPDVQKLRRSIGGVLRGYAVKDTCTPMSLLCTGAQLVGS